MTQRASNQKNSLHTSNEQTSEWSPTMLLRGDMEHPKHSGRYLVGVDEDSYAEALSEIDRQRAEIEQLRTLLRIARDEWYDDNGQWGDGFGLKHWTRKADALLSDESSFRETEQHRE